MSLEEAETDRALFDAGFRVDGLKHWQNIALRRGESPLFSDGFKTYQVAAIAAIVRVAVATHGYSYSYTHFYY